LLSPASSTATEREGSSERRPATAKPAVFDRDIINLSQKCSVGTYSTSYDHVVKSLVGDVVDSGTHDIVMWHLEMICGQIIEAVLAIAYL